MNERQYSKNNVIKKNENFFMTQYTLCKFWGVAIFRHRTACDRKTET